MTSWFMQFGTFVASVMVVSCLPLNRRTEIPEDFLIKLQSVQNMSQFLNSWVDQAAVQRSYLLEDDDDNAEVEAAIPAACIPEMQVVEFERSYDPSLVIWPICTRIRRCGGCCSSKLLQCVATRISTITLKVIKARYPHPGADMLELEGYETIRLEQHDRCACQCRQKAQDCTSKQDYHPGQCLCICRNNYEASNCKQPDHYWDSKDCECKCRQESECSTGSFFNKRSCVCEHVNHSSLPERVPGPEAHLSAILRDDGGENDAFRLRYSGFDPQNHLGPFALAQYQQEDRTFLLENVTQQQWTEN